MAGKKDKDEDQTTSESEEGEEGKSVGGKKKLIIILILVIFLAGAGAGAWFMGLIPGLPAPGASSEEAAADEKKEEAEAAAEGGEEAKPEGEGHGESKPKKDKKGGKPETAGAKPVMTGQPVFYELPEFLVNLNTANKQSSFIKMTVTLELTAEKDQQLIEANLPRILDACNSYLRELRSHEVVGSAGLQRLKEEMLLRISKAVEPTPVKAVLFNNILIQ